MKVDKEKSSPYEETKEIPHDDTKDNPESTARNDILKMTTTTLTNKPSIRITSEALSVLDTENQELMSRSGREQKDLLKDHPSRSMTDKDTIKPVTIRDSGRGSAGRSVTVIEKIIETHKAKDFFTPDRKPQGSEIGFIGT